MKKRLFAVTLACLMLLAFSGSAFALQHEITPFANAVISGSLTKQSGSNYRLQGIIKGSANDYLTIKAVLYKVSSSGRSYVTETSNSGYGGYISASKTVVLSSGKYEIDLFGTTPTNSPSKTISVTI